VTDPPCLDDGALLPGLDAPRWWWHDLGKLLGASLFEAEYCERSKEAMGSVTTLRTWGRYPEPCDCGLPECEGWRMGYQWEDAIIMDLAWEGK
jgi:hypothetical protein